VLADKADDLQEDIVPQGIAGLKEVEDGAEGIGGEGEAMGRGRGDGLEEVPANGREVLFRVVGLQDQMNEEIVGASEVLLRGRVQSMRGLDNGLKGLVVLLLGEERTDLVADLDEVGQLLGQLGKGAVDEKQLRGCHDFFVGGAVVARLLGAEKI